MFPTLAELAGAKTPSALGRQVHDARAERTAAAGARVRSTGSSTSAASSRPRAMGNWKAVRLAKDAPLELYDLAKDPRETTNVASQHPDVVRRIDEYLKTARTDSALFPIK
jgi:arylsulfatase A-like enzyme